MSPVSWRNPHFLYLSCFSCNTVHDPNELQTVCQKCALPLRVDYDLPKIRFKPDQLRNRAPSLWRYREVLPISPEAGVTLIEGCTPLIEAGDLFWIKDESRNPTGSFKARGMVMAVSAARALGAQALSAPSAGNAASALAAYGAVAGLPVIVVMPDDTPHAFLEECRHYGAEVKLLSGTIADCGKWLREHGPKDAFDVSTLREPYRIEGKKTMAYELFEQFNGDLPDVILYPTGGGTGLVGMWKAFNEMEAMGWIPLRKRPRLVSVQAAGCAPVVSAFTTHAKVTIPFPNPHTNAYGLRVPSPIGGFICLRALDETKGTAIAINEADIAPAAHQLARQTGLDICPEGGAAAAALSILRESGWIRSSDRIVLFNTGTGLKYR